MVSHNIADSNGFPVTELPVFQTGRLTYQDAEGYYVNPKFKADGKLAFFIREA